MTVLANTNIASLHGSNATFPNFLFGPEMNEAARSGQVDATNTGIVPTNKARTNFTYQAFLPWICSSKL